MNDTILSLQNITKQYPGVLALNDVSVDFIRGETHSLMGENGAGKSTLIKILSGAVKPDNGNISLEGKSNSFMTPILAHSFGISVIYQEFNLMPTMTVAENIFIDDLIGKHNIIDRKQMERKAAEIFDYMKVDINPKAIVRDLSTAYMQLVEIAKAISKNAKILVMDEPTASLTTNEVEILFTIIERLKQNGVTIIYISHRLNEVLKLSDRVTVLRDGKKISTRDISEVTTNSLIKDMVGRELSDTYPKRNNCIGDVVLEVENLCGNGVENISFKLHKGEILGLSGLVGAGRTEIMRVLFGADKMDCGEIRLHGKPITPKNPHNMINNGIALIPEDRKMQGALLDLTISQNVALPNLNAITSFGVINQTKEKDLVDEQVKNLHIATPSTGQLVKNLSGGNQQKVVLAKWLAGSSNIFIFDEPTRGIDVGAKQEIYRLMNDFCEKGMSIIMISSEMEELTGMSDRIVVLCEGRQTGILKKEEFSQERILYLASGENEEEKNYEKV